MHEPDTVLREIVVAAPARLDAVVRDALPALSRRAVAQLLAEGAVRVNGHRAPKGLRVAPGDRVEVPDVPAALAPEPDLPVRCVHADARILVLDKPGGMPSHAIDPRQRGTAAAWLLAHHPETAHVGERLAAGLVHRLDTGTSGLLVAARTPEAWQALRAAFGAHGPTKRYLAVVAGRPPDAVTVRAPLAHDPADRRRMRVARPTDRAWPAETAVRTLAVLTGGRALVEATIRTGVTHQVRAHLATLGTPVVGDVVYGGPSGDLPPGRHALHAAALDLAVPGWPSPPPLRSPLPADLRALCR